MAEFFKFGFRMGTDIDSAPDLPCQVNCIRAEEETAPLLCGKYEHYIRKIYWERFIRREGMSKDCLYF